MFTGGYVGVDIFLVISGYLITSGIFYKLSKLEFLRLYFNSIDSNIEKHPEYKAEDFIKSYTLIWNNYQIFSDYIDSYGHRWHNSGLSDKAKIEFINNKLNETSKK